MLIQEFLLFILPFISRRVTRRLIRLVTSVVSRTILGSLLPLQGILKLPPTWGDQRKVDRKEGKFLTLSEGHCAICAENAALKSRESEHTHALRSVGFLEPPSDIPEEHSSYPIYNPYQTSCGHVYCYHCVAEKVLQTAIEAEPKLSWECLRCGEDVKEVHRYKVDISESEISESDYDFSSDVDLGTDLSVSVCTYSGSDCSD